MSKLSGPFRSPRNTPQPKEHRYIGALVADDFGGMRALTLATANAFAKKKLDTASQSLQLRSERQAKKARRTEARADAAAERGLQAELRESDQRIRLFWRRMRTKVRPTKTVTHTPPRVRPRLWPYASVALPNYDGPVIDRRGERAVFARFRYYSRRTARTGVSQRVLLYCYDGAALDAAGKPYVRSNVGETIEEAIAAFDHLEQVNWSAQQGAKLLLHGILAVDHRQMPDEMMVVGTRWAEAALGRFDLPYLVTLHAPPPDGDQRNWHLHILWSFRPLVRIGDHEWDVAEMLRTDLDNPPAMKLMREMYAAIMTQMSFEAGQDQVWTAKSNAARGLPHEPQTHLGAARTNRARQGELVAANEENHKRVMRSKAAVLDDDLRHADETLARRQDVERAILGRWARPLVMPGRLPHRAMAASLSASLPNIDRPLARAPAIVVPKMDVPVPAVSYHPRMTIAPLSATPLRQVPAEEMPQGVADLPDVPRRPARAARAEIADLRIHTVSRSRSSIVNPGVLPEGRKNVPAPVRFAPLAANSAARADGCHLPIRAALPLRSSVTLPNIGPIVPAGGSALPQAAHVQSVPIPRRSAIRSVMPPVGPVLFPAPRAETDFIRAVKTRVADTRRRDDERRERAQAEAERDRRANAERAAADDHRRRSLAQLFHAIAEERRYLESANGRRTVDARLLERFGVAPADLMTEDAQKRIAVVARRQDDEVTMIAEHVKRQPGHIVRDGDGWRLDDAAPAQVRALVTAWRNSPHMQNALGRVVAARPVGSAPISDVPTPPRQEPGAAWRSAREMRDRTMADGDRVERLDGRRMEPPGVSINRPGIDRNAPLPIARRFPGIPGSGIGD